MEPNRPNPFRLAAIAATVQAFLPPNTVLGSHLVDEFLSHDGIVATYVGHHLHSGDRVLIREYFPAEIASRADDHSVGPASVGSREALADGLFRFIDCAQRLRRISTQHLVPVVDFHEANGTAYLVSAALQGETLDGWLERSAPLSDGQVVDVAIQTLRALEGLCGVGLCHREIREDQLLVRPGAEVLLLHADTLLHGVHPAFSTEPIARAVAAADLSALAALLTRLCHASAAAGRSGVSKEVVAERSPMLMMLIERALPGSRELDSLDAARWRKSFERLRGHLVASDGPGPSLPPPQRLRSESVVVSLVKPAAPVFPIAEAGPRPTAPPAGRSLADRAISWIEAGLIPALLVAAWFLLPHGDEAPNVTATSGQATTPAMESRGYPPPSLVEPAPTLVAPAAESAPSVPPVTISVAPGPRSDSDGNALPSTAVAGAGSSDRSGQPSDDSAIEGSVAAATAEAGDDKVRELLAAAAADLAARRMTVPAGNNAMEKFQAVLRLDRNNADARQGLRQIADGLAARASKSLAAGNETETEALLRRARGADPRNARVATVEQALEERRKAAALPRVEEPYPPRFEATPPAPTPPQPPAETDESVSRAEEIRQRFGGR